MIIPDIRLKRNSVYVLLREYNFSMGPIVDSIFGADYAKANE